MHDSGRLRGRRRRFDRPQFAIDIHNADGVYCAGINTRMDDRDLGTLDGPGLRRARRSRSCGCCPAATRSRSASSTPAAVRTLDLHLRAYPFSVVSERRDFGFVYLEHDWRRVDAAVPARPGRTHAVPNGQRAAAPRRACSPLQEGDLVIAADVVLGANVSIPQPALVNLYGCRIGDGHARSAPSSKSSAAR